MAIDNVPAVQSIIEQVGLLERAFYTPLDASLAYSRCADEEMFPNGIGETITKTRPALFPIAASITPMNPSSNTGLDNGLSDSYYTFEQYQLPISEYALSTTVNINQDRTLIERVFLQNVRNLGEHAGRTIDGLCAEYVHKQYDAGSTFVRTGATAGTTITVDNGFGFDTAFSASNSPGLPTPVTGGNPISVSIYNGSTGALRGTVTCNAIAFDGSNVSTANVGGIAYGASAVLTATTTIGFNQTAGDLVRVADGAYISRPSPATVLSRYQLAPANTLTLQVLANAVAKLKARNVPALPSGNYLCIMDPTLWPQLLSDTAFNYATMGQMGEGYFARGMVNRTLGVEFIDSNLVPAYTLPAGGAASGTGFARHCVIGGQGLLIRGTFQGSIDAARQANQMQNSDIRLIEEAKVALITRGPIDRLQEFVTQSWKWVGGFVCPTDVTSTPLIIPTTDYARAKRAVVVEVYSPN